MKKFLSILTVVAFLATAPMAMAKDPCNGTDCEAQGTSSINLDAAGGAIDFGGNFFRDGFAGGAAAAGGIATGDVDTFIRNGDANSHGRVTAGGIVDGDGYDWFDRENGGFMHGEGSWSAAEAELHGDIGAHIDPGYGLFNSGGVASGDFVGIAGQATGNVSYMEESRFHDAEGVTGGLAVQGSVGAIAGGFEIGAAGDFYDYHWGWCGGYRSYEDQYAGAEVRGGISMAGSSESRSWRGVEKDGPYRTEFMGTRSIAETSVMSYGDRYDYDGAGGFTDYSHSYLSGGYVAAGLAANKTVMANANGVGQATALGLYVNGGGLNCNTYGYANSKTNVSITTKHGAKGSVVSASAETTINTTRGVNAPQ